MVVMVVVMMMMVVMHGDDAIDGDVGGNDDGGRGALNWGTCKCLAVWVHTLNYLKSPLNLSGYCVGLSAIGLQRE